MFDVHSFHIPCLTNPPPPQSHGSFSSPSACMSLMFPTIYGIALDGLGPDAKIASAGLILAIVWIDFFRKPEVALTTKIHLIFAEV